MPFPSLLLLRILGALLCLLPLRAGAASYAFPYPDPFYATITVGILKADHLDRSLRYEDLTLKLLPERDSVPALGESRNKVSVRFWKNADPQAPLLVLLAGLGGAASATYHNFLASKFLRQGYHVLALPSPFHFSFALAASRSGLPGITRADAEDTYSLLLAALDKIQQRHKLTFPKVGLLGISMGALQGAFLSELDSRKAKVGFSRVLLLNPPVDPLFSMQALDELEEKGKQLSEAVRKELRQKILLFGSKALLMKDIKSPSYFLGLEQELPLSLAERQYLIGSSLRDFLEGLVWVSQQIDDLGVLTGKHPEERLQEAAQFRFQDYLGRVFLPGLSKAQGRAVTLEELAKDSLLLGVEDHLRANRNLFLFHNQDDFIVNGAQLASLKEKLGPRMTIFPMGGHVGNLWFQDNLNAIMGVFEPLKGPSP